MRVLVFAPAIAAGLWLGAAQAQPAGQLPQPEVLTKVYACADIADATARLACFDAAVTQLKTAETQGEFTAVDAAGVRRIEREAFGFALPSLPRLAMPRLGGGGGGGEPEVIENVSAKVARLGSFAGKPSVILDNGQTWISIDTNTNRNIREGAEVNVRRAALGSFLMSAKKGGAALRVRRVE
ncbi:MAG: hypothetical protein NW200_07830 [Hyphomonadaceae bacterium]|nr:hypothetical protein [Hyphomonadaceae bacterium]